VTLEAKTGPILRSRVLVDMWPGAQFVGIRQYEHVGLCAY